MNRIKLNIKNNIINNNNYRIRLILRLITYKMATENNNKSESNTKYLSCFYDTKNMRKYYPENYPMQEIIDSRIVIPGRIICTPEIGLFYTTLVRLDKNLSYTEEKHQIREQVELDNVITLTPNREFTSMEDLQNKK